MAAELSWLERGANNAKVSGSIPLVATSYNQFTVDKLYTGTYY